jgi:hypothetical protein
VTAKQGALPRRADADYATRPAHALDRRRRQIAGLTTVAPTGAADAHDERPAARFATGRKSPLGNGMRRIMNHHSALHRLTVDRVVETVPARPDRSAAVASHSSRPNVSRGLRCGHRFGSNRTMCLPPSTPPMTVSFSDIHAVSLHHRCVAQGRVAASMEAG